MRIRFYIDPETGQAHICEHDVTEEEVRQALLGGGDDFQGRKQSRIHFGQTKAGRYLKIVYVPDEGGDSVFVITAYDLRGNALKAFRRRRRKRRP